MFLRAERVKVKIVPKIFLFSEYLSTGKSGLRIVSFSLFLSLGAKKSDFFNRLCGVFVADIPPKCR